ncbi:MAG: glycosyltransferase [Candidatus Accumulibacter sp.]|jgi:spore maturation protein CgeB|uniref:Glycosyltransferase n=1 Tax=Candidatus Accumulibacter affinis TaxID=2954384 RepID=A0A935T8J0_9PROT|nr:glycosyltransferase [Candidatus Accumulibacter affinis]
MKPSKAKLAAEEYLKGNYALALLLYEQLAEQIGETFFKTNIGLCKKKLGHAKARSQGQVLKSGVNAAFKVAIIADEFTFNSFKDEFLAIPLEPATWRQAFESYEPDIFFCESAWSGPDSNRRPWKGSIYASVNFKKENRSTLLDILSHCRKEGIPSVFWNKEDPTHYSDRVHDFVKTAREFDFVFTTAAECIERYRADHGLGNVFALPFATNPRLFNPVETSSIRSSRVVFAGSWYANHKQRSADMETILDDVIAGGLTAEIYDRYHGDADPLHRWPDKYQPFLKPGQPHEHMPEVYKSSCFGLNFNTVTDSATMFARRVFELMSCNTLVVSNYARGVDEMFGDLVIFADRQPGRLRDLSPRQLGDLRERALKLVLSEHTYKQRWLSVLSAIGIPHRLPDESMTIVSVVRTRAEAMCAISWFQQYGAALPGGRLLLVASEEMPGLDVAGIYQEFNRFGVGVTSFSHAREYALKGRYQPIETAYYLLVDPKMPPVPGWPVEALLHLQYMSDHPIAPASAPHDRYRFGSGRACTTLLGHAGLFDSFLQSGAAPARVYFV